LLLLTSAVELAAAHGQTFDRPIRPDVPLTGPLAPVPPTPGTHVPRFRPDCRFETQRYHHPALGWMSRRVEICRPG
jgi:hypothetical protein